jgi:hypothetical protein
MHPTPLSITRLLLAAFALASLALAQIPVPVGATVFVLGVRFDNQGPNAYSVAVNGANVGAVLTSKTRARVDGAASAAVVTVTVHQTAGGSIVDVADDGARIRCFASDCRVRLAGGAGYVLIGGAGYVLIGGASRNCTVDAAGAGNLVHLDWGADLTTTRITDATNTSVYREDGIARPAFANAAHYNGVRIS